MATVSGQRVVKRARSEQKHAAILDAAEALFLAEGYERTSVDGIAARADVSKRTVYDHFGDKEKVFSSVQTRVADQLFEALRQAVAEELPEGCHPDPALLSFARRVATVTFASSEYVLFQRLLTAAPPSTREPAPAADPADLLLPRMAAFVAAGDLDAANPQRAVDHFIALTFLVALDALNGPHTAADIDEILVDGVEAFLRAYRPNTH